MSTKRFITKTATRVIVLTIVFIVIFNLMGVFDTMISNELALGQMENSNEAFAFIQIYNGTIKPIVNLALSLGASAMVISIILDTYKFIKTKEKNKNEETL